MVDEAGRDFYWFQSKAICRGSLLRLQTIDHPFQDLQDLLTLLENHLTGYQENTGPSLQCIVSGPYCVKVKRLETLFSSRV